jgi:hypothetical protein
VIAAATPFSESRARVPRPVAVVFLSWLAMLGVDLFLHAGVLAPLYDWDRGFLLRRDEAFLRIPAGYAALLVLAVVLVWLLPRVGVQRGREGALLAAGGGAVAWGALLLGLWSISTADPVLLAAWWAGQTAEFALGGYVVGSALAGVRLRTLVGIVCAVVALGAASAVILQSVGYAPAVTI